MKFWKQNWPENVSAVIVTILPEPGYSIYMDTNKANFTPGFMINRIVFNNATKKLEIQDLSHILTEHDCSISRQKDGVELIANGHVVFNNDGRANVTFTKKDGTILGSSIEDSGSYYLNIYDMETICISTLFYLSSINDTSVDFSFYHNDQQGKFVPYVTGDTRIYPEQNQYMYTFYSNIPYESSLEASEFSFFVDQKTAYVINDKVSPSSVILSSFARDGMDYVKVDVSFNDYEWYQKVHMIMMKYQGADTLTGYIESSNYDRFLIRDIFYTVKNGKMYVYLRADGMGPNAPLDIQLFDKSGNEISGISYQIAGGFSTNNVFEIILSGIELESMKNQYRIKISHGRLGEAVDWYGEPYFQSGGNELTYTSSYGYIAVERGRSVYLDTSALIYPVTVKYYLPGETVPVYKYTQLTDEHHPGIIYFPEKVIHKLDSLTLYDIEITDVNGNGYSINNSLVGVSFDANPDDGSIEYEVPEIQIDGYSGKLNGGFALNFYIKTSNDVLEFKNFAMIFRVGDTKQKVTQYQKVTRNGVTYCVFQCDMGVCQINDSIIVSVLYNGSEIEIGRYSARDYLDVILNNPEEKTEYLFAQPLVKALLNYGGYAQQYFHYKENKLVNEGLYTETADSVRCFTAEQIKEVDQYQLVQNRTNKDFSYYGVSLVCKLNTSLNVYYSLKSGMTNDDIISKYDFYVTGCDYPISTKMVGDKWCFSIDGISTADLHKTYTFFIVNKRDASDFYYINVSPIYYLKLAIQTGDISLANLSKAMYLYNYEARRYF